MLTTLDFDGTAIEYACWTFALPDGYIAGTTVDATFYWTAASGSGGVVWGISGRAIANDGALDQALGTAAEATDTLITANDVHVTSAATVTLAGSPAGGQIVVFKVYRDPTDGSDTMGTDAKLLGVKLEYATSYGD
jgi:hypothetical protein